MANRKQYEIFGAALLCGWFMAASGAGAATVKSDWGKTKDGAPVDIYTLKNAHGLEARIATYGGTLVSLKTPDRNGKFDDIVLGYDNLAGYLPGKSYFGALVGRYANRIGGGKFTLDGKAYQVPVNDGKNALHGGVRGFDKRVWTVTAADAHSLTLQYQSKDGEEGYPGNLTATVRYSLSDNNELRIDYSAKTDKDTVLNLTNHSYFNLSGQGHGDVLGDELTIHADRYTPTDSGLIPTGELRSVAGTPFDFRTPHKIGERMGADDEQLKLAGGYDHNWVLTRSGPGLLPIARVHDPQSGRVLELLTTQPGLQFYTSNFLDGTQIGKGGVAYQKHSALCLETQHFPDSPNKPKFPSSVLKPGAEYQNSTVFRFSVGPH